jgi:hypothetical protein
MVQLMHFSPKAAALICISLQVCSAQAAGRGTCTVNNVGWTFSSDGRVIYGFINEPGTVVDAGAVKIRVEASARGQRNIDTGQECYWAGTDTPLVGKIWTCESYVKNDHSVSSAVSGNVVNMGVPVISVKFPDLHVEKYAFDKPPVTISACGSEVTIFPTYVPPFGTYLKVSVF